MQRIRREVQPGLHIVEAVVGKEGIDTEVTSVVGNLVDYEVSSKCVHADVTKLRTPRMREMAENIAIVQPRHCDLRHDHLEEGRECREDAKLVGLEAKARSSGEVTAFHDPGRHEHIGVSLMDHLQTSRTFEITCGLMSASHRTST